MALALLSIGVARQTATVLRRKCACPALCKETSAL
jgi:hypothetical protein